jgi:hypothetical protein
MAASRRAHERHQGVHLLVAHAVLRNREKHRTCPRFQVFANEHYGTRLQRQDYDALSSPHCASLLKELLPTGRAVCCAVDAK